MLWRGAGGREEEQDPGGGVEEEKDPGDGALRYAATKNRAPRIPAAVRGGGEAVAAGGASHRGSLLRFPAQEIHRRHAIAAMPPAWPPDFSSARVSQRSGAGLCGPGRHSLRRQPLLLLRATRSLTLVAGW